jgi:hypothetical protein
VACSFGLLTEEFSQATDTLRTAAESIAPEVKKAIKKTDELTPQLNPLGSAGSNLYVCTDYTAPQHWDEDCGLGLCCQINKESSPEEFCFAYTQWGVYIETQNNAVW